MYAAYKDPHAIVIHASAIISHPYATITHACMCIFLVAYLYT